MSGQRRAGVRGEILARALITLSMLLVGAIASAQEPAPFPPQPMSPPVASPHAIVPPGTTLLPPGIPGMGNGDLFGNPATGPVITDPLLSTNRPLPGSIEDEFPREIEARAGFRLPIWDGGILTGLPPTLLWESPFAVLRDPRMRAVISNQENFRSGNSVETSIGGTIGLYRYQPAGHDLKFQADIFGVVHTRLSPEDVTVADYRFGFPLTFQWNWWHGKIAYEHTSGHIGDRLIRATGQQVFSHNKDEIVLGLGRWFDDSFRVYGHVAYAFLDLNPDRVPGPFRADIGFDWYARKATGFAGTPFLSANIEWREDQDFQSNFVVQTGWLWRNPYQRLGTFRLFVEYHNGLSPYGQFYRTPENYLGGGIAFDY